jgi:hypothetical protein
MGPPFNMGGSRLGIALLFDLDLSRVSGGIATVGCGADYQY